MEDIELRQDINGGPGGGGSGGNGTKGRFSKYCFNGFRALVAVEEVFGDPGSYTTDGGNGGSGTVIVRYQTRIRSANTKATGGAVSFYGGKTIHTFTSTGDFNNTTGSNLMKLVNMLWSVVVDLVVLLKMATLVVVAVVHLHIEQIQ